MDSVHTKFLLSIRDWFDGSTGKKWTASQCLVDHVLFLKSHGALFGAYTGIGGTAIEHDVVEEVMVAVRCVASRSSGLSVTPSARPTLLSPFAKPKGLPHP